MRKIVYFMLFGCASAFGFDDSWVVVDNADSASAEIVGEWSYRPINQGYGGTYHHDLNDSKGTKTFRLTPDLPSNSTYNVYLNWVPNNNRASNVPVTISHDGGSTVVTVSQKNAGDWVLLGSFPFVAGTSGNLLIETTGTDGYVIADAAAWEAVNESYEPSMISVVATIPETTEGDVGNPALITVNRSGSPAVSLDLSLSISGTATGGEDYLAIAEDNFFAAGESNRTLWIAATDDGIAEGSETVSITVLDHADYNLGTSTEATVTLLDSPFDIWREAKFTVAELADTNISNARANPDSDANSNLAEFFGDSNPKVIDTISGLELESAGTNTVLSQSHNPEASLLEVQFETATGLKTWQPIASTIEVKDSGDVLMFDVPVNNDQQQFWRTTIEPKNEKCAVADGVSFWSFDTQFGGAGVPSAGITYQNGFEGTPVLSQIGSAASISPGGADAFFGPDGNTWSGLGHSLSWGVGSTGNEFSIELSTLLQTDISIRFDIRSSLINFSALTYDTGMGPLPVPDANLVMNNDGEFTEWMIDLSLLDAINSRPSVVLTWSFDDLAEDEFVQLDNVVIAGVGRAKSQLVRNLEAGRLQTVVALGTSLTANGAWVGMLTDVLTSKYQGLATVLNSGAAGKNSDYGVANFNRLVTQKKPDTMFIEYGINDCVERFDLSVLEAQANVTYIVDQTLAAFPDCEIILMTMTPGDKYDPGHTSYRKDIQDYYAMYRTFARERGFLVIDHYSSWIALQTHDVDLFNSYVPDTIHPGAAGNEAVMVPTLIDVLGISTDDL